MKQMLPYDLAESFIIVNYCGTHIRTTLRLNSWTKRKKSAKCCAAS